MDGAAMACSSSHHHGRQRATRTGAGVVVGCSAVRAWTELL